MHSNNTKDLFFVSDLVFAEKRPVYLSADDLDELPQEILNEICIPDAQKIQFQALMVLKEYDAPVYLDKLLVETYRRTKLIIKRAYFTSLLHRMIKSGMIERLPNKKGLYQISKYS